jgi:aldoxime dehydratase
MESAIDKHLQCPRTRARKIDDDYVPPFPTWIARADTAVEQVVMGYFGVQFAQPQLHGKACMALQQILDLLTLGKAPGHHDIAMFVDAAGYTNMIVIAYWLNPKDFAQWQEQSQVKDWWTAEERLNEELGYFREILQPRTTHYETAFSSPTHIEGIGVVMGSVSAEDVQEHGYWGSMRDRIPLSQVDDMLPGGKRVLSNGATPAHGKRVVVSGPENLAVIRSGQDWIETTGKERDLYVQDMEPTLRAGMDFLHQQGLDIGCYSNRYMQHIDAKGQKQEKSFGVSYWHALSDLEAWSKSHPTHLAIFGTFMRIVQELQGQLKLSLYHEVSVLKSEDQFYEYINCHPGTGMLNGLA